jgi:hypothetical protein
MTKGRDKPREPDWAAFSGYSSPKYTQVPDELFDAHLAFLSGAELKVILYIIRRTFGFKKDSDSISISQMLNGIRTRDGDVLDYGVGLSKPTLLQALRSLVDKQLILTERRRSVERGDEPTVYKLRLQGESPRGQESIHPVVKKFGHGGGQDISPGAWLQKLTTQETALQETALQETVLQETDLSNIREAQPSDKGSEDTTPVQEPMDLKRAGLPLPRPVERPRRDFSRVADVLASPSGERPSMKRLRAQKGASEERQIILAMMEDFAREMGDEAPLAVTVQRAFHLWERATVPIEAFTALMYEARALTKEYSGNITKTRKAGSAGESAWGPGKNKIPYFFATLESIIQSHQHPPAEAPE